MVKFGKEFRKFQIKAWANSYINYKLLKQEIKKIRGNINQSIQNARKTEITLASDIGHPSLKPLELVREDSVSTETQDLNSLYNTQYGNELKRFIELLEKEFRKCYIHFVNQEKELFKKINSHCYRISIYKDYVMVNICNEIKEIKISLGLVKQLNCFINDNMMALKKILKKFDKNFQRYFGIIAPKYILSHLTSSNSDLEYLLQYKLIDESTSICENNLNILLNMYKNLRGKNAQNNPDLNTYDNVVNSNKEKIYEYLDIIEEITYFKIQYREWFYYAKQNDRIVKNNPKMFENDIYNPILSSAFNKDSILEKCISSKNAIKEVERSHSPISYVNKINILLISIQACTYGTIITSIMPVIPNYFKSNYNYDFKSLFLIPLIIVYFGQLLPFTLYSIIDNIDKKNNFMKLSYIISYVLILLSSFLLLFVKNDDSNLNIFLIIISRLFVGFANNQMFNKKYITLYVPKFRLSDFSKLYLIIEIIGMIIGPLIAIGLCSINESDLGPIEYTHFNSVGWYGMLISLIFLIIHSIFFINPSSHMFLMVMDESNISGNKYYQRSESEISRKKYVKKQNMIYRKTYNTIKKIQKENDNDNDINTNEDNNDLGKLIIKNVTKKDIEKKTKEKNKENNDDDLLKEKNDLEENLIMNDEQENNEDNKSFDSNNKSNSLDVSDEKNVALTDKQKNMINQIDKVLEKRNEECNFNDMNQIPKIINSIIINEKIKFGYVYQNILILFILFFIISLIKTNIILNYLYYIQDTYEQDINKVCITLVLLVFFQIFIVFFIIPFYQINYKFKVFILTTAISIVIFNLPLIIESLGNQYSFIIMNILMVLACNITEISCSCYLSFLLSPGCKVLGKGVGSYINYIILCGKIIGGIICLFLCGEKHANIWVIIGISFAFFIFVLVLIFFSRILKIRAVIRVIRRSALETNSEH